MRWLDGMTEPMDMNLGKLWAMVREEESGCAAGHGVAVRQELVTEQQEIRS